LIKFRKLVNSFYQQVIIDKPFCANISETTLPNKLV